MCGASRIVVGRNCRSIASETTRACHGSVASILGEEQPIGSTLRELACRRGSSILTYSRVVHGTIAHNRATTECGGRNLLCVHRFLEIAPFLANSESKVVRTATMFSNPRELPDELLPYSGKLSERFYEVRRVLPGDQGRRGG